MRRVDAADGWVLAVALTGAVLDAHLVRHDRRLITTALRRPLVLACLTALTLHAWDLLGPWDPFRFAAKRIAPTSVALGHGAHGRSPRTQFQVRAGAR